MLLISSRVSKGTMGVCRAFPTASATSQRWGWKGIFPSICGFAQSGSVECRVQQKPMLTVMCCPEVKERERREGCGTAAYPSWVDEARETEAADTGLSRFLCRVNRAH